MMTPEHYLIGMAPGTVSLNIFLGKEIHAQPAGLYGKWKDIQVPYPGYRSMQNCS